MCCCDVHGEALTTKRWHVSGLAERLMAGTRSRDIAV